MANVNDAIIRLSQLLNITYDQAQVMVNDGGVIFSLPVTSEDLVTITRQAGVPKTQNATQDLSAAAGTWDVVFTVPSRKVWNVTRIVRGACTAAGAVAATINGTQSQFVTGTTSGIAQELNLRLAAGDTIDFENTGNAGDNAKYCAIFYTEENAQ